MRGAKMPRGVRTRERKDEIRHGHTAFREELNGYYCISVTIRREKEGSNDPVGSFILQARKTMVVLGGLLGSAATPCAPPRVCPAAQLRRFKVGELPLPGLLDRSTPTLKGTVTRVRLIPRASVTSAELVSEPATDVKFLKGIQAPGCSSPLFFIGAGFREKVFAIIGVKVYAAGFYANPSIADALQNWKGRPATEIIESAALFESLFQDSSEKSIQIVLVQDVDGKTFWDALNDVISTRIKEPTAGDAEAIETFSQTFQTRALKKGTTVLLTWAEPSKLLVSISSDGFPSSVDAAIESKSVAFALFDGFFGPSPVSPTLKASVANGIMILLDQ